MFNQKLAIAVNERREAYKAHRMKIEAHAEELNKGAVIAGYNRGMVINTEPTWGKDGRPHAPFDGYLWEDIRTGNVDAYGGGQYLPYSDDFDDLKPEYQSDHGYIRILMSDAMISAINESDYRYAMSMIEGKSWEIAGVKITAVKFYAHKSIQKVAEDYAIKLINELRKKEKSNKGEAPIGRVTIKGEVIHTKVVESLYGASIKCLIKLDNGSTVWGTLPSPLHVEYRGPIEITATFDRKDDDLTHSFFKRPILISHKE